MGKESKKKRSTAAAASRQQSANSGSHSSTAAASNNSTRRAAAVAADARCTTASLSQEIFEPIAKLDIHAWDARFPFFGEKTLDPLAKELDVAHEIFLKAIQLAETSEDWPSVTLHIASAYLRDKRVVILDGVEAEKALSIVTFCNVMGDAADVLSEQEFHPWHLSLGIMALIGILAGFVSRLKDDTTAVQSTTVFAMKCLSVMLDVSEDMLKNTALGKLGCLTHAKVHFLRGLLYRHMFNGKSALKDWNKALQLDPSLAVARLARLHLWAVTETKTRAQLHDECLTFLGLVHDDYSELDAIYALLASSVFSDARLGTYAHAMEYYRKSLQATDRRVELYGPRDKPDGIISHVRAILKPAYEGPYTEISQTRKEVDALMPLAMNPTCADLLEQQHAVDKTKRNKCLNCKKDEGQEGIQLSKCGRCKQVYYCSKECIRANWKDHKVFCNMISGHTTPQGDKAAVPMDGDRKA